MNQKWIVSVTAGKWQISGIEAAKRYGLAVLGIDGDDQARGLSLCDYKIVVDIHDRDRLISSIKEAKITPSGVFSYCSEVGMLPAAWIREHFDLPGPKTDDTLKVLHKNIQRKIWQKSGVDDVRWCEVTNERHCIEIANQIGLPVIIKPIDCSGSRGVSKVETANEIMEAYTNAKRFSRSGSVLVEECVIGVEYTVESFSVNGETAVLAVTEKTKLPQSRGTVASVLASPTLPMEVLERVKEKVKVAIAALGIRNGPTHTEVIVTLDGRIALVEMAGRGGGFGVFSQLVPLVSGLDVDALLIAQSIGDGVTFNELKVADSEFVLRFFPVIKSGRVHEVCGVDQLNMIPGVTGGSFVETGDLVSNELCDNNRLGYYLATAKSKSELQARIDLAERALHFDIR
jgi:biotin carboxylase